jgi:hypothetical protein
MGDGNSQEIEAGFVHTHKTDGGEVIAKGSQIPAGIGKETVFEVPLDHFSLDFQGRSGNSHHPAKPQEKLLFSFAQVSDAGKIDGDHPDGAGFIGRAEEPPAAIPQGP